MDTFLCTCSVGPCARSVTQCRSNEQVLQHIRSAQLPDSRLQLPDPSLHNLAVLENSTAVCFATYFSVAQRTSAVTLASTGKVAEENNRCQHLLQPSEVRNHPHWINQNRIGMSSSKLLFLGRLSSSSLLSQSWRNQNKVRQHAHLTISVPTEARETYLQTCEIVSSIYIKYTAGIPMIFVGVA